MIIRRATLNDAHRIQEITKHSLGYDYNCDKLRLNLIKILDKESDVVFVVEIDITVAGYIHACDYDYIYDDHQKDILSLAVDPNFRKRGGGHALLRTVESWAKESNCHKLRLISGAERTSTHQFYINAGYSFRKDHKKFIKEI